MLDHVFHCNVGRNIHFIVFAVLIMRYRYRDASLTSEMIGLDEKKKQDLFYSTETVTHTSDFLCAAFVLGWRAT